MSPSEARGAVLITGASSGLGLEFAKLFAAAGHPLVLSARREDKLQALAAQLREAHGVAVTVLPLDLAQPGAASELSRSVVAAGLQIEILVNNAGFGTFGEFNKTAMQDTTEMLQLNVIALAELTHLFLPHMLARGRGKILNVGSVAGFLPGPYMSAYYASKAFVGSFSQALGEELRGTGVTVSCLCPGPTVTEFGERGSMKPMKSPRYLRMGALEVAHAGFDGLMKGRALIIPGFSNKFIVFAVKHLPRAFITRQVGKLQRNFL